MSNGRIKGFNNAPTTESAYGAYTLREQLNAKYNSQWPAATDPYWSSVKLLMHMDGANNSTTFTDSSTAARIMTARGDAKIVTADSKFGGACAYFDGTGDMVDSGSSADFTMGTGEWTVDCWAKEETNGTQHGMWSMAPQNASSPVGINLYIFTDTIYSFVNWNTNGFGWASVTPTQWHHYALQRTKYGGLELFIDGVLRAPTSIGGTGLTPAHNFTNSYFSVGAMFTNNNTTLPFKGWIDEVRVTKGVARYRSNFRVPNGPYPNA